MYRTFHQNELVWDRVAKTTCECEQYNLLRLSGVEKADVHPSRWAEKSMTDLNDCWQAIVRRYSGMKLSHTKDVFPALQGLAKRMPPRMGQYLAGLWRETLITGLT